MDSNANCLLKILEATEGALSKREAAELLRQAQRDFDELTPSQQAFGVLNALKEATDKRVSANILYDLQMEVAEKTHLVIQQDLTATLLNDAEAPVRKDLGANPVSRKETEAFRETGVMPKGAQKKGIALAWKGIMLNLSTSAEGARNQFVAPFLHELKDIHHEITNDDKFTAALIQAFDGTFPKNAEDAQVVGRMAATLTKVSKLMHQSLASLGIPVARDISPLFSSRIADPAKLFRMGRESFMDLVESIPLKREYLSDKARDSIREYAGEMFDAMTKTGEQGLDYNSLAYLTSSKKVAEMGKRYGMASTLPFADAAAFAKYAKAVSDKSLSDIIFGKLNSAGAEIGIMRVLGAMPGKTLSETLTGLADKMTVAEQRHLLGRSLSEAPLHAVEGADGKWMTLPAEDSRGVPVLRETAVADLKLDAAAYKEKYGKQKVLEFESEAAAREHVRSEKQNLFKGAGELFDNLTLGMPRPSTLLAQLVGDLNAPENSHIAGGVSLLNGLATSAALGEVIVAQIPDVAFQMQYIGARTGTNFAEVVARNMAQVFPDAQTKDVMAGLNLTAEAALESIIEAHGGGASSGKGVRLATDLAYKLNGMRLFDTAMRRTTHEIVMDAVVRGTKEGGAFLPALRDDLAAAGLSEPILKSIVDQAAIQTKNGRWLIDASLIADPTLAARFFTFAKGVDIGGVGTPTSFDRAILSMGTNAGTVVGAGVRLLMAFKSFPVLMASRVLPRVGYDSGAAGKWGTLITASLLWYVGDSVRQQMKGREPRDITNPNTLFKMAMMAGGFGYADMFIDPAANSKDAMVAHLAGPTLGALAGLSIGTLSLGALLSGDSEETEKGLRRFWKGVYGLTPSAGPIFNTPYIGGQTALEFFGENVMLGLPELLGMMGDDQERRREANKRFANEYGTLSLP